MGIIVSVGMGMISPSYFLRQLVCPWTYWLSAGAATVGCCANMIGFIVASYRENKVSEPFAQGIGQVCYRFLTFIESAIWIQLLFPVLFLAHCQP